MKKFVLITVLIFGSGVTNAQQDTISLAGAFLSDSYLNFAETKEKTVLSDSILQRNGSSLTTLLNFNSLIYLKENGPGMVSSPSFRGTTASQTAVIWNGININSRTLGQTDFNTVNPLAYDNLVIRAGGGSIAYGTGAIGGSVHLNNELNYNKGLENRLFAAYGSFDTYSTDFKSSWSDDNISLNLNIGRAGSDNDFKYPNSDQKNLNGKYYNNSLSLGAAYKINPKHELRFLGNLFDGDRQFSLISPNALPTKYHDYNTRSMIEWVGGFGRFSSDLKLVHLGEEFKYYPNIHSKNYEFGNSESWIAKYNLNYKIKNIYAGFVADYDYSRVKGSSIKFAKRNTASAGLFFKHRPIKNLLYEASVRQEFSDSYTAPFLYSLGISWDAFDFYKVSLNTSKDFRMPTFNDLFWPGSGNPDLKSETSYQYEIGNQFKFNHFNINLNAYSNEVTNLIQWIPVGSISVPENVGKVSIKGIEAILDYHLEFNRHNINLNASYAYTKSENKNLGKQLIYVPFHRATASAGYSYKRFSAYYQLMLNGKVYTDSQNTREIKGYNISNLGAEWNFGQKRNLMLGVQLRNIWDEAYQNVMNRWMPGRNYNVYINLKF